MMMRNVLAFPSIARLFLCWLVLWIASVPLTPTFYEAVLSSRMLSSSGDSIGLPIAFEIAFRLWLGPFIGGFVWLSLRSRRRIAPTWLAWNHEAPMTSVLTTVIIGFLILRELVFAIIALVSFSIINLVANIAWVYFYLAYRSVLTAPRALRANTLTLAC